MLLLGIFLLGMVLFESLTMKPRTIKDTALLIGLTTIAAVLGFYYLANPYEESLVHRFLKLVGFPV